MNALHISLNPRQLDICRQLDDLYANYPIKASATQLFEGALFALESESRSNPDWKAQAANSLRELLYPFYGSATIVPDKGANAFAKYGSVYTDDDTKGQIGRIYGKLNHIAHHGIVKGKTIDYNDFSLSDFKLLLEELELVLVRALARQIDIHNLIDEIVLNAPDATSEVTITEILKLNADARRYFFTVVDEQWLEWLWNKGYIKLNPQPIENDRQFYDFHPELIYLMRMSKTVPDQVVTILLQIPIVDSPGVHELLDRLVWLCSDLPSDLVRRIIPKILSENWVKLLPEWHNGHTYDRMIKTLKAINDHDSLLLLCELLLQENPDVLDTRGFLGYDEPGPFLFRGLADTDVFETLANCPLVYSQNALTILRNSISKVICYKKDQNHKGTFVQVDRHDLLDIDFFSLKGFNSNEVSCLISAFKTAFLNAVDGLEFCEKQVYYSRFVETLPDCRCLWRLKLCLLSYHPEACTDHFIYCLNRLFDDELYYHFITGPEYLKALQSGFPVLVNSERRSYVRKTIDFFDELAISDSGHLVDGSKILSMVIQHLTDDERTEAESKGYNLDSNYEPSRANHFQIRAIRAKGPISQEQFGSFSVVKICEKLCTEWTPTNLSSQNTEANTSTPINAEGITKMLEKDMSERPQEYLTQGPYFFNRGILDSHYTYAFLESIEHLDLNKDQMNELDWQGLFALFDLIKTSGEQKPFLNEKRERSRFNGWLADWTDVHSNGANVLESFLRKVSNASFTKYRTGLFEAIRYLLSFPDPTEADEKKPSLRSRIELRTELLAKSPREIAIGSVRGMAFFALEKFIIKETGVYERGKPNLLATDIKELYQNVLMTENTRAIRFMYGQSLHYFYSLDSQWAMKLLPEIFGYEPLNSSLSLAAWEGFLYNRDNVYTDLFEDDQIQSLYRMGIGITEADDPGREYSVNPSHGVAVHLGLACIYGKDFDVNHILMKEFLTTGTDSQLEYFVESIGHIISSNKAWVESLLVERPYLKDRLKVLWLYLLNIRKSPSPLKIIGLWIDPEISLFEQTWLTETLVKTLEKTGGILNWMPNLSKSLESLAVSAPQETLHIVRLCLLQGFIKGEGKQYIDLQRHWPEALNILYNNPITQKPTRSLINELIANGGSSFWPYRKLLV